MSDKERILKMKSAKQRVSFSDLLAEQKKKAERYKLAREQAADKRIANTIAERAKLNVIIRTLLLTAEQNLRGILSGKNADRGFAEYLQEKFVKRGRFFGDSNGICGFPPPPHKWVDAKGNEAGLANLVGGKIKELVGTLKDYEVNVCVLDLFNEIEIKNAEDLLELPAADGEQRQTMSRVIALTAKCSGVFSYPNSEGLKNCRLVLIEEYVIQSLNEVTYGPADFYPKNPNFQIVLDKLAEPESAYLYFLERFGMPTD